MTIASTLTQKTFPCNGVATQFAFPNKIFSASDLVVTLIDTLGNLYPFVNQANSATGLSFTVQGVDVDAGCTVVMSAAPTNLWTLDVRTSTSETQSTSIKNQGGFLPELHEEAFDRLTRMVQDLLRLAYTFGIHGPDIETTPWPGLPIASARKGQALMFDPATGLPTLGVPNTQTITTGLLASFLNLTQSPAEAAAAVTPVNLAYPPIVPDRYATNTIPGTSDMTSAVNTAISVASQALTGNAVGAVVNLLTAVYLLSSEVTLPNDVRFLGQNKAGSILRASGSWNSGTSPYMLHAVNGVSSMFDSLLESMTVDCNNIAGLSGILSDAWQENSGPRRCLIFNFRNVGIRFQNGFGGAAYATVSDAEIFSSTSGATAGIRVEQISSVGSFKLVVDRATIASPSGSPQLPRGIDIVNDSSDLYHVHGENCTSVIYLDGTGSHVIIGATGDNNTTNLVEIAATFRGTVRMLGCKRSGATNFLKDNRVGGYGSLGGTDYADFTIATGTAYVITGITQAASAVVTVSTVSAANPFAVGSKITFATVLGMTQINGLQGTASAVGGVSGAWTATVNINSSGFGAYSSAGIAILPPDTVPMADLQLYAGCTFDGTATGTNAPASGFNVTSVTRNSAGDYTLNFTRPLSNVLAQCSVMTGIDSTDGWWAAFIGFTTTTLHFTIRRGGASAGAKVDTNPIQVIVAGRGS